MKTWVPFGWSGLLGVLTLTVAVFTAGDAPTSSRTSVEPLATIGNVIGGLLLLGSLAYLMYLSTSEKKKVSTGAPLVWGVVVGAFLLHWNADVGWVEAEPDRMNLSIVFAGLIYGLLLLGGIGLAIYVTAKGKEVKTWGPFKWSGVLGGLGFVLVFWPTLLLMP